MWRELKERKISMVKKTTPEKPPSKAMGSKAAGPLRTGHASPSVTRSMAGRIESERSALAKRNQKK
jgi:hypothetical protein